MMSRRENMLAIYRHQAHDHIGSYADLCQVGGDAEEFENGPAGGSGENVAIFTVIAHPAVDLRGTAAILHDEVVRSGSGYYCR